MHAVNNRSSFSVISLPGKSGYYNVSLDYLLENPKPPKQESEFTLKEEELIDMYRELSEQNKEVILRNFYILLNPDARQNYEILKYIK